ncbi:hypothetical protein FQR65_LT06490 [Abscondita terminalis]|nr:hypothetical protein FQR65_LT06490 [Abscondita terminalis]
MADWIHCNKCSARFRSNIKYFVTSCGHLTCESCASKTDGTNCAICKSPCDYMPLNKDLKPEMQDFFRPQLEAIEKTKQICMFQESNKSALLKSVTEKYGIVKTEFMKCYKSLQEYKKENARLKAVIKGLMGPSRSGMDSINTMFLSPNLSVNGSSFLNAHNPRRSTPFANPLNSGTHQPWNSHRTPQTMMEKHVPNATNNSFALSSLSSMPDRTLEVTPINAPNSNHRQPRPSTMMSISNLNLGLNKPR